MCLIKGMVFKYQKNADGEFVCPHCSETRKNQNTMHYHLKKHEGALPHTCKHCDKKFLHKNMLDLHIQARHSENQEKKEQFKCPCENCDFTSLTKANRMIHFMRMHCKDLLSNVMEKTTTDKVICKSCDKQFNNSTAFYYHATNCCKPTESHKSFHAFQKLAVN